MKASFTIAVETLTEEAMTGAIASIRNVTEVVSKTGLALIAISDLADGREAAPASLRDKGLSPREIQILTCLVTGGSNKAIAARIGITEATVKVHIKGLLRKIDVRNRTQAAIWALNNGVGQSEAA